MCAARRPDPAAALVGSIALRGVGGAAFTEQRVRLLEAIDRHGSLSRAAAALPMSYKAAWDALDQLDRLATEPLVQRRAGGRAGGGTRLTDEGRRIVALYRALEQTQQSVLDRLPEAEPSAADTAALRGLVRRLAVRSSARNQFAGEVSALRDEGGRIDVALRLDGGEAMVVAITPASVRSMGLARGVGVHVLVKAPWVQVLARRPRPDPTANVLEGTVRTRRPGRARTEITVQTDGGLTLVASLPRAPDALREGARAFARIATDSAILLRFDA